jgi:hypothetical protein
MRVARLKEKRCNLMLWAILSRAAEPRLHWFTLLEWARLGGTPDETPKA